MAHAEHHPSEVGLSMMFWYKLTTGMHLLARFLLANLFALVTGGRGGRWRAILRFKEMAWTMRRLRGTTRLTRIVALTLEAGVTEEQLQHNPEAVYVLSGVWNASKRFDRTIEFTSRVIDRRPNHPGLAKCYGNRGTARVWLGLYGAALEDLKTCRDLRPRVYVEFSFALTRAFVHSQRGELANVREALAEQYSLGHEDVPAQIGKLLAERLASVLARYPEGQTVGVMFGNYDAAVGHAILDPFHTIQLYQDRFDHLLLVHPPLMNYAPTPMLAVQILHNHIDQVESGDPILQAFAWQYAGEVTHERTTFLLNNYWSLNRAMFHHRSDATHELSESRSYFALPARIAARADRLLRQRGLDPERPIVVVHMREHGYHALSAQSFRNVEPSHYLPALRWLTGQGYLVVRIGDKAMQSLAGEVPGLIELPLQPGYDPALDLFLIERCRFMVSCQSGPCSFARAFGRPNLIVNAVYHYSLLPERAELVGFKHYIEASSGRELSVEEIFDRVGHLFDRTSHFEAAGIRLEDMTPGEILAAVQEMDAWVDDPELPETRNQMAFRSLLQWHAKHPPKDHPLWHPHADYIGYSLPECRILESLCQQRPGYVMAPQPVVRPALLAAG